MIHRMCSLQRVLLSVLIGASALAPLRQAEAARKSAPPPSVEKRFEAAEHAYDRYKFKEAITKLTQLLEDPEFRDGPSRQKARLLLAFSHYISQNEKEAVPLLEQLFRENLEYPLDRNATHPDLLQFYDREHAAYSAKIAPASAPVQVITAAPVSEAPAIEREAPRPPPQTIGDRHKWVRIFPGGIGHFLNHDYPAGATFLTLEAALVATNVTFAVLRQTLRLPDGSFPQGSNHLIYQWVMNGSAIAAITLAVIEIIDAFAWSPARGRASLAAKLVASLGPLGDYRFGPAACVGAAKEVDSGVADDPRFRQALSQARFVALAHRAELDGDAGRFALSLGLREPRHLAHHVEAIAFVQVQRQRDLVARGEERRIGFEVAAARAEIEGRAAVRITARIEARSDADRRAHVPPAFVDEAVERFLVVRRQVREMETDALGFRAEALRVHRFHVRRQPQRAAVAQEHLDDHALLELQAAGMDRDVGSLLGEVHRLGFALLIAGGDHRLEVDLPALVRAEAAICALEVGRAQVARQEKERAQHHVDQRWKDVERGLGEVQRSGRERDEQRGLDVEPDPGGAFDPQQPPRDDRRRREAERQREEEGAVFLVGIEQGIDPEHREAMGQSGEAQD